MHPYKKEIQDKKAKNQLKDDPTPAKVHTKKVDKPFVLQKREIRI